MAQQPFEQALKDEGLVGTPLESLARSIYTQESGGGKNTKTSNAGAVGGMQVLPGTFKEVLPEGDINNPYDNARAGLRYIKKMYDVSGGDLNLTAVGYYGGPGGIDKAKKGIAVSDPRNPNAPNTLEYARQVLGRTDVSRGTTPKIIRKNIEQLGTGYQAAFALMASADEEPENEREKAAREEREDTESAQQFAGIRKQLTSVPVKSAFPEEPMKMANGGLAGVPIYQVPALRASDKQWLSDIDAQQNAYKSAYDDYYKNVYTPYSTQVDEYNKAVEAYNAGPRTSDFTTPVPTAPAAFTAQAPNVTQAEYDARVALARERAKRDAEGRAIAIQAVQNPDQFNLAGFSKAGLAGTNVFAQGGEVRGYEDGGLAAKIGVPMDTRTYFGTLFGNRDPISEKDFTAEELKAFQDVVGQAEKKGRNYVTYEDYKAFRGGPEHNPHFAAKTTLGRFNYQRQPDGTLVITDRYDFDNPERAQDVEDYEKMGTARKLFEVVKRSGGSPTGLAGQIGAAFIGREGRDVKVTIPPVKRAEGSPEEGEVKGKAFESPQTAKQMLKDVGRGVSYYPYDLVGAPVDVINMGLKAVDYLFDTKLSTPKPVGGSEYLIEKSRQAGIAEKPTGSAAEELARFGSAFVNPAAGARATGRVLSKTGELAAKGAEKVGLEATRAITKNPDVTAAQMYEAMLGKQGPVTAATRPKGGVFMGAKTYTDMPLTREDEELKLLVESLNLDSPQGKAIGDFFDKKVRKYLQTQKGTADDPVFKALLQGRIEPRYMGNPETWQAARAGDPEAIKAARTSYDTHVNRSPVLFEEALLKKDKNWPWKEASKTQVDLINLIKKQSPEEPISMLNATPVLLGKKYGIKGPGAGLYTSQTGVQEVQKDLSAGALLRMLNETSLPPHIRQAAASGEPIFTPYGGLEDFHSPYKLREVKDYLATRPPEEIKNMGLVDAIVKSNEWHANLANRADIPYKTYTYKEVIAGTKPELDTTKGKLNWVEIKTEDALKKEGELMGHCVGTSGHCEPFLKGDTKVFSLRDVNGMPHVTVEVVKNDGTFNRISELKGRKNSVPTKYFGEVDEFLNHYQGKLGDTPLRIVEQDRFLPKQWRTKQTPVYQIIREDDAGAQVRYTDMDGVQVEEYIRRDDPRFPLN